MTGDAEALPCPLRLAAAGSRGRLLRYLPALAGSVSRHLPVPIHAADQLQQPAGQRLLHAQPERGDCRGWPCVCISDLRRGGEKTRHRSRGVEPENGVGTRAVELLFPRHGHRQRREPGRRAGQRSLRPACDRRSRATPEGARQRGPASEQSARGPDAGSQSALGQTLEHAQHPADSPAEFSELGDQNRPGPAGERSEPAA